MILEKPFGHDYDSAVELNETLHAAFDDSQIFRIDHFLGKEAVQNILALRFANGLYEPLWNRNNIEFVQIDVPETLSIGHRAGFYEGTGAYRDMVVTHLLQLLSFIAMEPPAGAQREGAARGEGQGDAGVPDDRPGEGRPRPVRRATAPRTASTPSRTPRRSSRSRSRSTTGAGPASPSTCGPASAWPSRRHLVTLDFREPPMRMFPNEVQHQGANQLVFELSEPGSITADFQAKVPGRDDGARPGPDDLQLRAVVSAPRTSSRPTSG